MTAATPLNPLNSFNLFTLLPFYLAYPSYPKKQNTCWVVHWHIYSFCTAEYINRPKQGENMNFDLKNIVKSVIFLAASLKINTLAILYSRDNTTKWFSFIVFFHIFYIVISSIFSVRLERWQVRATFVCIIKLKRLNICTQTCSRATLRGLMPRYYSSM